MSDAEKCKQEILKIMQHYGCIFVLEYDDTLSIVDSETFESETLADFSGNS
jgi:hypothetical protein